MSEITVELITKTDVALDRLHESTGMSRTDIINRAVQLYDFIDAEMWAGHELLIKNGEQVNRVHLTEAEERP